MFSVLKQFIVVELMLDFLVTLPYHLKIYILSKHDMLIALNSLRFF